MTKMPNFSAVANGTISINKTAFVDKKGIVQCYLGVDVWEILKIS